jgi:hypothetical protein
VRVLLFSKCIGPFGPFLMKARVTAGLQSYPQLIAVYSLRQPCRARPDVRHVALAVGATPAHRGNRVCPPILLVRVLLQPISTSLQGAMLAKWNYLNRVCQTRPKRVEG